LYRVYKAKADEVDDRFCAGEVTGREWVVP